MSFDFELILFYAVLITGLIALFDIIFLARRRNKAHLAAKTKSDIKMPIVIDYARSFFPVLLLVFLLRSFAYEPFRIPSGSLAPTLAVGDFILVNKFHYGFRLPILRTKIYSFNEPARGDIVVFLWPPNPSIHFIKRVIGIPGDHISYINKILYINGKEIPQTFLKDTKDVDEQGHIWNVMESKENLLGVEHAIYQNIKKPNDDLHDIVVPEGMYFAMGDNRDNSADSRFWGFIPDKNILGKANLVWMNWDSRNYTIHWGRIGRAIH